MRREWVLTLIKNYYSSFLLGSHSDTGHDSLGESKTRSGSCTYRNTRSEVSLVVWACGLILALACQQASGRYYARRADKFHAEHAL